MKAHDLTPHQREQLSTASILGSEAYNNNRPRIPQMDPELRKMIDGRMIGVAPKGELPTTKLIQLWLENYDAALEMAMSRIIK